MSADRDIAEILIDKVLMGKGHTFDPTRLQMAQIHATLAVAVEVEALRTSVADVREELRGLRGMLDTLTNHTPGVRPGEGLARTLRVWRG